MLIFPGALADRQKVPDRLHLQAGQEQYRRTHHVAVEILRIPLRFHQTLPATRGTPHPIRVHRVATVVRTDHFLGQQGGLVHRQVAVVDHLPRRIGVGRAGIGKRRPRLLLLVVPGVGRGSRVALAHGRVHGTQTQDSRPSTAAFHLETVVPVARKLHCKLRLGPDRATNVAMLRQCARCGDQLRRFDLHIGAQWHRGQIVAFLYRCGSIGAGG